MDQSQESGISRSYPSKLSTFWKTSTQPNGTYNKPKSRNWDKWIILPQRLSWAIYTRYLPLPSSSSLWRLTVLTWVPSLAPRYNQMVLTIGQNRETGRSGSYHGSDCPELSIPGIYLYWVPAYLGDLQFSPEYRPKHLDLTKRYLQ